MSSLTLHEIAEAMPLGAACRQCGDSAYNWVKKCARYLEDGTTCCPEMRSWIKKADAARSALAALEGGEQP